MLHKLKYNDEVMVWLTAAGLSIGLLSIIYLLGVMVVNGVKGFWPHDIYALELAGSERYFGERVKIEDTAVRTAKGERKEKEHQYFLGNKDVLGFNFKYILATELRRVSAPQAIIEIERTEYGPLIGKPQSLQFKQGEKIYFGSQAFDKALEKEKKRIAQNRKKIKAIEKTEIGRITHKIRRLEIEKKKINPSSGKFFEIESEQEKLQQAYEALADTSAKLRDLQHENQLVVEIAAGPLLKTKSISTGNLIDYHYPNQMNLFSKTLRFISQVFAFLFHAPREANTEGGVFPAIFGTFMMTILMSAAVMPFGVITAVYLHEYAKQGIFVRIVRIAVNNLAGVPSIVFGVFGLGFFIYLCGHRIDLWFFSESLPTPTFGTGGILWASLTLALMTVPVVIVATEEGLSSVPKDVREGAMACGASKWQTLAHVILPASAPGLLTGLILAIARGAGEVAPLMLVGAVKLAPTLPLDEFFPFFHLERKFMHLGFHIYDLGFQSPDSEAVKPMVFATALLLIALVIVMNFTAIYLRTRLRKKYQMGAF